MPIVAWIRQPGRSRDKIAVDAAFPPL